MTNFSIKDDRRQEDKKYTILRGEIAVIKSGLDSNTVLTNTCINSVYKVSERLDHMEPIINKIGDIMETTEMAFKVLSALASGISWIIKRLSKTAKILIPIGTLLLISATILQQFFNKDLSIIFSSWWESFTGLFK